MPPALLERLAEAGEEKEFAQGAFIARQHDEARFLYFLVHGTVEFLIHFEGVDDLLVGAADGFGEPIGWSIARDPPRYTTSVRCTRPCRLFRLPRELLMGLLEDDPEFGIAFLRRLGAALAHRLVQARDMLVAAPQDGPDISGDIEG